MLPDIASHKTASHISGFAQPSGTGILSRSFEDLHPQPDRYEVIWNGTISAQEQKAEQRTAEAARADLLVTSARPVASVVVTLLKRTSRPLTMPQIAARTGLDYTIVHNALYRLTSDGFLSSSLELNADGALGKRKWMRVYSLPAKVRAVA